MCISEEEYKDIFVHDHGEDCQNNVPNTIDDSVDQSDMGTDNEKDSESAKEEEETLD